MRAVAVEIEHDAGDPHPRGRRRMTPTLVVLLGLAAAAAAAVTGEVRDVLAASPPGAHLRVVATEPIEGLAPGSPPHLLSGTFDNSSNAPVWVGSLTVSIAAVHKAADAPPGRCDASDFVLTHAVMPVNATVPVGRRVGTWSGARIAMTNTSADRNGCQGASVALAYNLD